MTYTIEELEAFINDGTLQLRSDGITHLALTLASQLLDTMREAARLRAALEWYAAQPHYRQRFDPDLNDFTSDVMDD
jgi:hypothetical protein